PHGAAVVGEGGHQVGDGGETLRAAGVVGLRLELGALAQVSEDAREESAGQCAEYGDDRGGHRGLPQSVVKSRIMRSASPFRPSASALKTPRRKSSRRTMPAQSGTGQPSRDARSSAASCRTASVPRAYRVYSPHRRPSVGEARTTPGDPRGSRSWTGAWERARGAPVVRGLP